jgi:hypothetical protein
VVVLGHSLPATGYLKAPVIISQPASWHASCAVHFNGVRTDFSCARSALIRNLTKRRRASAIRGTHRTNRAGLRKYRCSGAAPSELVLRTTRRAQPLRAQRVLQR